MSNIKFSIALTLIFILISGCGLGEGETTLQVTFQSQPRSGINQTSVSSEVTINRKFVDRSNIFQQKPEPKDINLTIEWWWEAGDRSRTELISSRQINIDSDFESFKITHSARTGYILLNYYYLKVFWNDDNGSQIIESNKAFFEHSQNLKLDNNKLLEIDH